MRILIITRGAPATGKSRLLADLGLARHTLSADTMREVIGGPILTSQGRLTRRPDVNAKAWAMVHEHLETRMSRGELVAVDGINAKLRDIKTVLRLADAHGYRVIFADFRDVPVETAIAQDRARDPFKQVGETVIRTKHAEVLESGPPEAQGYTVVRWNPDGAHRDRLDALLQVPVEDVSAYTRVVHVGDLQGCLSPLIDPRSPLAGGLLDPHTLYVFVGDFLDRGIENGEVMRWALDTLIGQPNVRIVRGNHEAHIELWARGKPAVSAEFEERTLPQLQAAWITPASATSFMRHVQDALFYRFGEHRVMVTHAGLSTVPDRPALIPTRQYTSGTGFYESSVDRHFEENAPDPWVQVHGHRNPHGLEAHATPRSFNLEDQVEHGGNMRFAVLSHTSGWETIEVPNSIYAPARARARKPNAPAPAPWLQRPDDGGTIMPPDQLQALRDHPMINEKPSETFPHVSAFAAKAKAFYDGLWDAELNKARGLHVNNQTGEIVARAWDKFPNLNEIPSATLEALLDPEQGFAWPVSTFVKENGFLGLIGYDRERDSLYVASKSKPEGTFADLFRAQVDRLLSSRDQELLRRRLRDSEACLIFEVIDPAEDPHMIPYDAAHLVLLDVMRRSAVPERLPYATKAHRKAERVESVQTWAQDLGVRVKEPGPVLPNAQALTRWLEKVDRYDHAHTFQDGTQSPIEGYVLEDARGRMVKLKLPYYGFWKYMRSPKDRVRRIRGTDSRLGRDLSDPAAAHFVAWCQEQPDEVLALDIIQLRTRYLAETQDAPEPRGKAPYRVTA